LTNRASSFIQQKAEKVGAGRALFPPQRGLALAAGEV
jgi:hypothetical protein